MATWLRNAYNNNWNYIRRSAEKLPEEFYGLRPGPQVEVRTFGQILGHPSEHTSRTNSQNRKGNETFCSADMRIYPQYRRRR
jgi:hypothetical protein